VNFDQDFSCRNKNLAYLSWSSSCTLHTTRHEAHTERNTFLIYKIDFFQAPYYWSWSQTGNFVLKYFRGSNIESWSRTWGPRHGKRLTGIEIQQQKISAPGPQHWAISVAHPGSGAWPLTPRWVKCQDPDPGWTYRIIFPKVKISFEIKFFSADPASGYGIFLTQDPGQKKFRSGKINPQYLQYKICISLSFGTSDEHSAPYTRLKFIYPLRQGGWSAEKICTCLPLFLCGQWPVYLQRGRRSSLQIKEKLSKS
jgi:hypothetical protein